MKKIITALANPKLSLKIQEECDVEIIAPDIQYQDGVLEILENNKNIEILILNSLLEGNFNIFDFINKIKEKNNIIKIIIILEEKNTEIENFLNSKRISDIFYNNKNTINELIKLINKKDSKKTEEEINEEIKILKELILENNNKNKFKNIIKNKFKNIKEKSHKEKIKSKNTFQKNNKKIISVIGTPGVGKSVFCAILAKIINNKKILIIDLDKINSSINSIFGIKKENKNITKINKKIDLLYFKKINNKSNKNDFSIEIKKYLKKYDLIIFDFSNKNNLENIKEIFLITDLIFFISEANLIEVEKSKNLLNKYINEINKEKINIVFNKYNNYSIQENILKNIFSEFNILGKIKLNNKYNLAINSNLKIIDKKIKKDYLNIIKKGGIFYE